MNVAAKVAQDKQAHPERFCKVSRCLWKVVKLDHATQTFSPRPDCPNGYCPRHQHLVPKASSYRVTLINDSQAQDREDSTFDVVVKAYTTDEASEIALRDQQPNVYVIAVAHV